MKEVDRLGVECTGDLTRGVRIAICVKKVENAKIEARIQATKADTEATRADTEATRARTEKLRKENAELIREIQRRIREDK
jgi:predicted thioesterase